MGNEMGLYEFLIMVGILGMVFAFIGFCAYVIGKVLDAE